MKIRTILTTKGTKVITVHPEQTLKEAAVLLAEHNIGALVVVDNAGQPVGIISERDIICVAAKHDDVLAWRVSEAMTKDLVTGLPQDDLSSVAHTMQEKGFRHLPIVEHGELVGIVSIRDVMEAQRDQYMGEIDTLETQIIQDEA
jgi:CBS domain-containing protein